MPAQLVWFKRDLRVVDHRPLVQAVRRGPCICLYVYEPEVMASDHFDPSHLVFVNESLRELDEQLRRLGARLTTISGRLPDVFDELHERVPFEGIWSHEETGNAISYARDRRVAAWAEKKGIAWTQVPTNGVVRRLRSRDGWSRLWLGRMNEAILPAPDSIQPVSNVSSEGVRSPETLGMASSARSDAQRGGVQAADQTLRSFVNTRGVDYRRDLSSPVTAWNGCSRLSPYLAWGNLSMRQVYQSVRDRSAQLKRERKSDHNPEADRWIPSLAAYAGRLRWHCHFIQKLEDQPSIEHINMSRAYDGLREDEFDPARFEAWCVGATGYPLVDACMRALHRTGWINFRMRAMLVSFASYHLWLDWRPTSVFLARQFLDFEPGIHFSQVQMQSGVTGINTVRIYSPIKQVRDQDPKGVFIRQFCPELQHVPVDHLAEPHKMPARVQRTAGCVIGKDYPAPIVEHASAYREARRRIHAVKRTGEAAAEARRVYKKHGSRRRPGGSPSTPS